MFLRNVETNSGFKKCYRSRMNLVKVVKDCTLSDYHCSLSTWKSNFCQILIFAGLIRLCKPQYLQLSQHNLSLVPFGLMILLKVTTHKFCLE